MTLTELEYGALASSSVLNRNFQYLQTKITELSNLISSETSSYSSSVATLNKNITDLIACKESFIPTGAIFAIQISDIPSGFLLCDGSEIKISEYENLYKIIGTTYGQSDSTTFCIPDLSDKTLFGASAQHTLGTVLESGLPNITGNLYLGGGCYYAGADGAFTVQGNSNDAFSQNWYGNANKTGYFDASSSDEIYGKSTIVQPPAIVTNFVIKY